MTTVHDGQYCFGSSRSNLLLVGGSPRLQMAIGRTKGEIQAPAVIARPPVNERPRIKLQLRREYLISAEIQAVGSAGLVRIRRAVSSSTETALSFTGSVNDSRAARRLLFTLALLNAWSHAIMTIDK
jgi:hypothetical protein